MCTCEHLTGTSARYACSEEHDHECKPSPHRHTSASTSVEKAGQAARADCGSAGDRTGCARSTGAANVFTIPLDVERDTASSGGLARECSVDLITERSQASPSADRHRRHCAFAPVPSNPDVPPFQAAKPKEESWMCHPSLGISQDKLETPSGFEPRWRFCRQGRQSLSSCLVLPSGRP